MWYSIEGITSENWPGRVAGCLPPLLAWVRAQQRRLGVGPAATALGGFSQGAILSLAAAQQEDGLVGRVLAFGGCLVAPPEAAPQHTTLHLFHGSSDEIIPADGSRQALAWIGGLQGDATLDIAEGVGHELHPALIDCALHRLTHHIPLRTWRAALGAATAARVA
ncbi:MAG: esterase [Rubrivivax sp.]|nr:esterase [Rubrivivax sp.]